MSPAEIKRKAARRSIRQSARHLTKQSIQRSSIARQPIIVQSREPQITGIRSFTTSRFALGYILGGYKFIYTGDLRYEAGPGDIFFLAKGSHYIEDIPDGRKPFQQIMFFYTSEQLARIIAELSHIYQTETCVHHTCEECMLRDYVIAPGWDALRHFFTSTARCLQSGLYIQDRTAESLALTTLVYQIVSRPEGCLRTRVLGSTNPEKELMERQLRDYIFSGITIEELARRSNRSLSSFKKKFKEFYNESPHRWVVRQRLMHARLQIISTNKAIALIGADCFFPNTSHFIKSFRDEFGLTPVNYREKYGNALSKMKK